MRRSTACLLAVACVSAALATVGSTSDRTPPALAAQFHVRQQETTAASLLPTTPAKELLQNDSIALQGRVDEDCCDCTYQAVDDINRNIVNPILTELVKTAFFKYFKVNIHCDCPLWPDDGMCMLQACSVCVCDPSEVPKPWLAAEACASDAAKLGQCDDVQCGAEMASLVDRQVEPAMQANLLNLKGWRGYNNPWMAEGEDDEQYEYINLLANPERYTGYAGSHPHRIWRAIYGQPVFTQLDSKEKVVFHRLISGMHASISAHLSAKYLLDQQRDVWGPNLAEFNRRLGSPEVQERLENLYFSYLFVLSAVIKASPQLEQLELHTGLPEEDGKAQRLLQQLLSSGSMDQVSCPRPFDESGLWQQGESSMQLKQQLQQAFRNITRVMDCVGCEKCKLWGKLQTLGVATALKILFESQPAGGSATSAPPPPLHLERNEVIALVNLLERLSTSIEIVRDLSLQVQVKGVAATTQAPSSVFSMFAM